PPAMPPGSPGGGRHPADFLAARLARLAAHGLALVANALALVGLRRPQSADLRSNLADDFLVRALDLDHRRRYRPQADALRGLVVDGVRVAEVQREPERLRLGPIPDTDDLERLLATRRDAFDHVRDEGPAVPVQGPVLSLVAGALDQNRVAVAPDDPVAMQRALELTSRPLDSNLRAAE